MYLTETFFTHMNFTVRAGMDRGRSERRESLIPLSPPVLLNSIHFVMCLGLYDVSSSPRSGLHPSLLMVRFNLLLPLWQQLVVQLSSKVALSCSKNYHSFSFGSQPMWPLSNGLFTIHLKSPLTSQSVVKWNNHWFLTRCINLYTIMERKENRGLRNNRSNNQIKLLNLSLEIATHTHTQTYTHIFNKYGF